jgi:hypothetical protein
MYVVYSLYLGARVRTVEKHRERVGGKGDMREEWTKGKTRRQF